MTEQQITQTLSEMLTQRAYVIEEDGGDEHLIAVKPDETKVCAFLEVVTQFNVKAFATHVGRLHTMGVAHGIIVYSNMTPATKKLLLNTTELKLEIETFEAKHLRYNVTKHRLVPVHSKATPEEVADMRTKGINPVKLPVLKLSDRVARFYAFKRGDVIKVKRSTGFVAYRIVK
jgi:DNA-directed RNA polymerase subunit H (RpoH/RPB5)